MGMLGGRAEDLATLAPYSMKDARVTVSVSP